MNQFEIKTIINAMPELNITNIYTISKQYNEDNWGGRAMDVVVEYKYNNLTFLECADLGVEYEAEEKSLAFKIKRIKAVINRAMDKIQCYINDYPCASRSLNSIGFFVNMQIDLEIIIQGKPRLKNKFFRENRAVKIKTKKTTKQLTNIELYKESIELARKEAHE